MEEQSGRMSTADKLWTVKWLTVVVVAILALGWWITTSIDHAKIEREQEDPLAGELK